MQKIKGKHYFVLLCCDGYDPDLICGVYSTKKEAEKINAEIKDCVCKHKIKKCSVEVTLK